MDLVVSNLAGSLDALVAAARVEAAHADVLELRLDACAGASEAELRQSFASLPRPVLAAANGSEAYGTFAGTDAERLALLARAEAAGADWVDVPWTLAREHAARSAGESRSRGPRARRVVSRHVLDGTPAGLESILAEVEREVAPGDRIKLVTHARCAEDGLRVLRLAQQRARAGRPIAAFASGLAGSFTRALAPVCGSLATYAGLLARAAAARLPRATEADALRAMWPANGASTSTRILGVAGLARPVARRSRRACTGRRAAPCGHRRRLRRVRAGRFPPRSWRWPTKSACTGSR